MGSSVSKNQTSLISDVLQKNITNVLNTVTTNVKTFLNTDQQVAFCNGPGAVAGSFTVDQRALVDAKIITSISNDVTASIKDSLSSEINNTASQTMKIVRDMLSTIGSVNDDEQILNIQNRLHQIVEQNVTTTILNDIVNGVMSVQGTTIINFGTIGDIIVNQDIQLTVISNAVVNNLIAHALEDSTLSRIVNDAKQDLTKTEKGINSLLDALLLPLIIIGVVLGGGFFVTSSKGIQAIKDPKFIFGIFAIVGGVIGLLFGFKVGPFKKKPPPEYWGCETDAKTGFNTGKCIQYNDNIKGNYVSLAACQAAIQNNQACSGFWGCEKDTSNQFTGNCAQYTNALNGPYYSQNDCTSRVRNKKACQSYWGCNQDYIKSGDPVCKQYNDATNGPFGSQKDCETGKATCNFSVKTGYQMATTFKPPFIPPLSYGGPTPSPTGPTPTPPGPTPTPPGPTPTPPAPTNVPFINPDDASVKGGGQYCGDAAWKNKPPFPGQPGARLPPFNN